MYKYRECFFGETIIAPDRKKRPIISKDEQACPFCLNNISTLGEIYKEVWNNDELWVRIVNNKYPILNNTGEYKGVHDVIIDTGIHNESPRNFSIRHWEVLLDAMKQRWDELESSNDYEFIQIFKNNGTLAGASIFHSHWQLLAFNNIPSSMIEKYNKYQKHNSCFLCEEMFSEDIIVYETDNLKAIIPPKPKYNYEVWIVTKKHRQHYGELIDSEVKELGYILKRILEVYNKIIPGVDYNICMMSGDLKGKWNYHFHVKIMMRTSYLAGFEIATDCYVLTQGPKQYAVEIKRLLKE